MVIAVFFQQLITILYSLLDTITLVLSVDSLYEAVVTDLDNPLVLLNAPAR